MGHFCLDEFKAQGAGWVTPSHEKTATTRPLCHTTTQPLYHGAGRTRPEEALDASAATYVTCSAQGHGFDSLRVCLPFAFNLAIMKNSCAHSESVEYNLCKLWQNYSDCNRV